MKLRRRYPDHAHRKNLRQAQASLALSILVLLGAASLLPISFDAVEAGESKQPPLSIRIAGSTTTAGLSESATSRFENAGNRLIKLSDARSLLTSYEGPPQAVMALRRNEATAFSAGSGDFDEDGVPDLVCGYASPIGGILTLHRGNVDSIYPNAPDARQRREGGRFTTAPFLSPARAFDSPELPELLGAGDFDADDHCDVVTARPGSNALWFYAGDGHGGFAEPRKLMPGGEVTALEVGEINRRDGLPDIVAGIRSPTGAKALVFESPLGAINAVPEEMALPAPATSLALGEIAGGYERDLAIAAGNDLIIIEGRDRRLSFEANLPPVERPIVSAKSFNFKIKSLAIGNFSGDAGAEIAMLCDDGRVRANRNPAPASGKRRTTSLARWRTELLETDQWLRASKLVPARVSSNPRDNLLVVEPGQHRVNIIDRQPEIASSKSRVSTRASSDGRTMISSLISDSEPAAVLPMRLNGNALSSLVVLNRGRSSPAIVFTTTATFTVNSTGDASDATPGDGVCDDGGGNCTLRAAIQEANANPGQDTVNVSVGSGLVTITPGFALPQITDALTLDGTTQPGFAGTPVVEFSGAGISPGEIGLALQSDACVVRGFVINGFPGSLSSTFDACVSVNASNCIIEGNFIGTDAAGTAAVPPGVTELFGVFVLGSGNTIGGTTTAARNLITGNDVGVAVLGAGNFVLGNFIGTDLSGTVAIGNSGGVRVFGGPTNTVGGTTAGSRNLISGNSNFGLLIEADGLLAQGNFIGTDVTGATLLANANFGVDFFIAEAGNTVGGTVAAARNIISGNVGVRFTTTNNLIQGNFIGTDQTGITALGNLGGGIFVSNSSNTVIGGTAAGARNIISGQALAGVQIDSGSASNTIQGNFIGTDVTGASPLGNAGSGVQLDTSAASNTIGGTAAGAGNIIGFNGGRGINAVSGTGNAFLANSVFSNGSLGIDLGNDGLTTNDTGDADSGANNLQNFPVLTSVTPGATTAVQGTLNSTPGTTFRIEFFSITSCDASGNGEGTTFLAFANVTTNGSGNAAINLTLPVSIPAGNIVIATATDPSNNTSEFSACVTVAAPACTITCPPNQNVSSAANQCGALVNYPAPVSAGVCGAVTCVPASGGLFPIGATTVNCSEPGGGACSFTVTVVDDRPPILSCSSNISKDTDPGKATAVIDYIPPAAIDNCPGATSICLPPSGFTAPTGATTVTCTATDVSNNTASCSFIVTVGDAEPPGIQCSPNVVSNIGPGQSSSVVTYPAPVISDNLAGATATCAPPSGSRFPLGVTTVSCTATDSIGNRASCSFTVTVAGGTPAGSIIVPGGGPAIEFGIQSPTPVGRKPKNGKSPCGLFSIENSGFAPLRLTLAFINRVGADVEAGRISDPAERELFELSEVTSSGALTVVPVGSTIVIAVGGQRNFCLKFLPAIPALAGTTTGLRAPQAIPDLVSSRVTFSVAEGTSLVASVNARVATAAQLINPNNPRKKPFVTMSTSGSELSVSFSVFDANLDVNKASFEFLDAAGRTVAGRFDVDLVQPIRERNLVRGQSFSVEQRFSGAGSHPEITSVRVSVSDSEGTVVTSTTRSSGVSGSLVRVQERTRIALPTIEF